MPTAPIAYFRHEDQLRTRHIGKTVPAGTIDIPEPPSRIVADWRRETTRHLALEPGDVEVMPLARTQARWPELRVCIEAANAWTRSQGLGDALMQGEQALMVCRGAHFHHDGARYAHKAFCNVFLSEDKGLDLLFPEIGRRLPLQRGTVVVFDTGQPHGVVKRGSHDFAPAHFPDDEDHDQIFLSWELSILDDRVADVLGVRFDAAALDQAAHEEGIVISGLPAALCPVTGHWLPA